MKETVLTGIKPTGSPHIGNYFGAIKPAIDMISEGKYNCCYFIADYHALTTVSNAQEFKNYCYEIAATWLAAGLDPGKALFYKQSDLPEVFELNWILCNVTPKGLMDRAHAYKAAADANIEKGNDPDLDVNMGLYNYPILMAADIVLLNSNYVPVGLDQKQHIEFARDIAGYFNKKYGKSLVMPKELIDKEVCTLVGLDGRKMSKSYNNTIPLFCTEAQLRKKVMSIITDSTLPSEPKSTDSTVFTLYKLFAGKEEIEEMKQRFLSGISWAEAKGALFEKMNTYLSPMREKYNYYMENKDLVDKILREGAESARKIAAETLTRVRKAIGKN